MGSLTLGKLRKPKISASREASGNAGGLPRCLDASPIPSPAAKLGDAAAGRLCPVKRQGWLPDVALHANSIIKASESRMLDLSWR